MLCSCGDRSTGPAEVTRPDREAIEETNRYLVQKDRERVENYIERHGLEMTMSETGLWYRISKMGEGEVIRPDDIVKIEYDVELLDGTSIYTSDDRGLRDVRIGRSNIETGLDEGLRLLRGGGEALFIIPSYLAYGLLGDGEKIPSRAILVCKVRVLEHNGRNFGTN